MTFSASISTCFSKYAVFEGRAPRSEYWWFILFQILVEIVLQVVGGSAATLVSPLFSLAVLLPSISVATRRLHDVNRSGWWQLVAFTIIGLIPLLFWLVAAGDEEANDYGAPV